MKFEEFKEKHKLITSYKYTWAPIDKGYNNRTLYVNVGTPLIKEKPVTQEMKDKFIGGKDPAGLVRICLWMLAAYLLNNLFRFLLSVAFIATML